MGLSRTVSEINGDFGRKSQKNPSPSILRLAEGVLGIGCRDWGPKNYNDRPSATGQRKKLNDIFSQVDKIHQREDGRTDTGRQQKPRLRIASRGENQSANQVSFTCTLTGL